MTVGFLITTGFFRAGDNFVGGAVMTELLAGRRSATGEGLARRDILYMVYGRARAK